MLMESLKRSGKLRVMCCHDHLATILEQFCDDRACEGIGDAPGRSLVLGHQGKWQGSPATGIEPRRQPSLSVDLAITEYGERVADHPIASWLGH